MGFSTQFGCPRMLIEKTAVLTSATLKLGGDFDSVATGVGLKPTERSDQGALERTEDVLPWRGIDVGSPFDYSKQGILYLARHLPPPGRDGLSERYLDEVVSLVAAAGGHGDWQDLAGIETRLQRRSVAGLGGGGEAARGRRRQPRRRQAGGGWREGRR